MPSKPDILARLSVVLPEGVLGRVAQHHLEEPRGRHRGIALAVARPRNTDEVAQIVRAAAQHGVSLVPYGGGTGLVAGQIVSVGPAPVLLSLDRMAAIRAIHPDEDVIEVEAGATLAAVQEAAADAGRLFPLSYGSEGTATIGAALAVNSGGTGVLRYGAARELCLGLEAVLPDGSVFHGAKRLRKDNTGYDLRNLLIGAEGTLGVITAASLRLFAPPASRAAAVMDVAGPAAALALLGVARAHVGEAVSGFELISGTGLRFLAETGQGPRWPLEAIPDWAVLIDLGLSGGQQAADALEEIFASALDLGLVSDGALSQSDSQRRAFWDMREAIPLANRAIGAVASHDISLPLSEVAGFLARITPRIEEMGALRVNAFGHLGDGNLHYNVFPAPGRNREDFDGLREAITRLVHDEVVARGGSFSAEHGIGRLKVEELERYGDPAKLAAMRAIKNALDPGGIMNPGAVLRAPLKR